ncbi:Vitamin B12 ABC transporter, permease component BtuC [hydrothermal vent metagenome]|uniref:Vitamin B12 ABC transporter, permease component BtuC n=1 Tax=hydrothermal vent metagenome TaxID=652676 RepID=A0A3B0T6U6_9ZZZZ
MNRFWIFAVSGLVILVLVSLTLGAYSMSVADWFAALLRRADPVDQMVIWQIRLPRSLLAVIVGAGLGGAGAALQGLLRNPLADPAVVGISSSASLLAVLVIYTGLAASYPWSIFVAAMTGACFATLFLLVLSMAKASATTLILGGVALSALATALTGLLMNLSPNPWALSEIAYWLMGSVADRSFQDVLLAGPLIGVGLGILLLSGRGLDVLTLGEDTAHTSGLPMKTTGPIVVVGTLFCVGAGVAVAGAVGFIGLAAPHLVRPFLGHQPGRLILPSALVGGILLLLADMVVRGASGPGTQLYLGVVTALLGAPLFLLLVWKIHKERL